MSKPDTTAIVLAGGRGRRLDERDKGLVPLWRQALIAHVLARVAPQVVHCLISANRNEAAYRAWGYPVVGDATPDFAGPLAGIAAGMRAARDPLVLVVPCDAPCLPRDLAARLHDTLQASGAELAVAHDGARLQHACFLAPAALADDIEARLARGERKLQHWIEGRNWVAVAFDDPYAFVNLNTPDDFAALERRGRCEGAD
jgi:molybdopterin-guanine dinucleotide biosynthesis protein A